VVFPVLFALIAIVCSQIPLLNYLGFEFSAVTAVIGGYLAGLMLIRSMRTEAIRYDENYWLAVLRTLGFASALATVSALLMLANALLVKNCSLSEGALFFILLVYPSLLFSIGLASVVVGVASRFRPAVYTIIFLLVLAQIPIVTLTGPQIYAFNPIIGFFPGVTYDESIQITERLATYRAFSIAGSLVLIAIGALLWRRRRPKPVSADAEHPATPIPREWILIALLLPASILAFAMSDGLGFSSSESYIRTRLAGRLLSPPFEIVYASGPVTRDQAERIARFQTFSVERMRRNMELRSNDPITIFIYATPEQKARLTGAARTAFAKPWLRQVHVSASDGQQTLTHELGHVVAAEFGITPLLIGRNPGLIEGFAVAMEGRAYEEPLHTAAAMALNAGASPDLHRLYSISGFMTASPGVAYTLAGSFSRYLIDHYGAAPFKRLYAEGDVVEAYGKPLDSLLTEWKSIVSAIEVDDGLRRKAQYYFKRPTIFMKECARVIAQMNQETARFLDDGQHEEALASADRSLALSRTPEAILQRVRALSALRFFDELIRTASDDLVDTTLGGALLPLRLRLGDAYWAQGKLDSAAYQYELLRNSHLSSAYDEVCAIRLSAMRSGPTSGSFWNVLTREAPDSVRFGMLEAIDHSLAAYLRAGHMLAKDRFTEAATLLAGIGPLRERELEYSRLRRIGRALYERGELAKALPYYAQALSLGRPGERLDTQDWIDRCSGR
jgi:tetratricopeptide (TPR) repeat protein